MILIFFKKSDVLMEGKSPDLNRDEASVCCLPLDLNINETLLACSLFVRIYRLKLWRFNIFKFIHTFLTPW